ncbi:hypothetical protein H8S37_12600 [Mediterraneibacter sp. NSJ-55]|uniref:Uncharacterized protein n=1 Tax=Mediterraneibacter hominis TaxID=2763054 RepID=A0A923LKJ3_9FIRM|nr:hypothetical protein [Mediterraneibacter hominis]MBC5689757.1 hypothetical protein [Mediterraneibacter hominis]
MKPKKIIHRQWSPVICPGCREVIKENEDLSKVEYVRTKRKTDVLFHTACIDNVWGTGYKSKQTEENGDGENL